MKLTNRLQAAADLVPVCESMADIGTDHGYLPIYLVQEGRARRAIACDVNDGPLATRQGGREFFRAFTSDRFTTGRRTCAAW